MTPRRVFSIDDSVVVRRMLSDIVGAEPGLQMVGTAPNGMVALAKLATMPVDVITLDVEMPEMNGLEVLVQLKQRFPRIPVIMFSTLTERGASATLEALARGATDYVTKPATVGSVTLAQERVRADLQGGQRRAGGQIELEQLPRCGQGHERKAASGRGDDAPGLRSARHRDRAGDREALRVDDTDAGIALIGDPDRRRSGQGQRAG